MAHTAKLLLFTLAQYALPIDSIPQLTLHTSICERAQYVLHSESQHDQVKNVESKALKLARIGSVV